MRDDKVMIRYLLLTVLAVVLSFAAEVGGKWKIHSESSTGEKTDVILELREDWGNWTAVIIIDDHKIPLKGISVDGDKLAFQVTTEEATYSAKAIIKGDRLEGSFTGTDGAKGKLTGQRQ